MCNQHILHPENLFAFTKQHNITGKPFCSHVTRSHAKVLVHLEVSNYKILMKTGNDSWWMLPLALSGHSKTASWLCVCWHQIICNYFLFDILALLVFWIHTLYAIMWIINCNWASISKNKCISWQIMTSEITLYFKFKLVILLLLMLLNKLSSPLDLLLNNIYDHIAVKN